MQFRFDRRWLVVVFAFTTAAVTACGDSKQAANLAAPSATVSPAPSPASPTGATISGTVVGVTSASAVATHAVTLTVSISGTATTAVVDGNGRFVLQNVPAGHVDLHFTGPGVDAHLGIDNVVNNASIAITVRVSGSSAQLDNDDRQGPNNEVEVEGLVTSKSAATITVNGRMIEVGPATQIVHGNTTLTLAQINVGDRVHVKGTPSTTTATSVAATKIEVQNQATAPANPANPGHDNDDNDDNDDDKNPPPTPGAKAEVEGAIAALSGTCPTLTFTVGSTTVKTNASTQFKDTTCTGLKSGNKVEVKGTRQADNSVLATRVEKD